MTPEECRTRLTDLEKKLTVIDQRLKSIENAVNAMSWIRGDKIDNHKGIG